MMVDAAASAQPRVAILLDSESREAPARACNMNFNLLVDITQRDRLLSHSKPSREVAEALPARARRAAATLVFATV